MKRLLCLALCLMLAVPCAFAETADTLPKLFVRQLTGGTGLRGYMTITASGVAEWLTTLLPFTATDIQIRAIGEKQGEETALVTDDDDWQVRFFVKNSDGAEVGNTWLYGDPEGVYFQSELLPDTLLTLPVEEVNLLYQLLRGDYEELFFTFDPLSMKEPGAQGNASAYEAVAKMLDIPAETWEADWLPVLEKYFLQLDLWLTSYGTTTVATSESGALTMGVNYEIPADEFKAEAKYIIGQMLYDNDLQNLLLPYVTMEQRVTYLNPNMVYFYDACIDALALKGDIMLSREMSAQGDIVSARISLPVPVLPETLTAPVGSIAAALFGEEYADVLAETERIEFSQNGAERSIVLSGAKRTVTIAANVTEPDGNTTAYAGTIFIQPAEGKTLAAAFELSTSHSIWADENYLDHDTSSISFAIEPAFVNEGETGYADFDAVSFALTVDYRNNPYKDNSPVQVNYELDAQLPDASVHMATVLRISTATTMEALSTEGAESIETMSDERKAELLGTFIGNVALTMENLSGAPAQEEVAAPAETAVPETEEAEAEPTAVPPMTE